jgi:hypothetical protein
MIVTRWSHLMAHEPLVDGAFDRSWVTSLLSWSMTCFFALMAHAPSSHHVKGIRAPLSAPLWCRRERNRSHDDEFHRHALDSCDCI